MNDAGTLPRSMAVSAPLVGVAMLAGAGLTPVWTAVLAYGVGLLSGALVPVPDSGGRGEEWRRRLVEGVGRFDAGGGLWIVWGLVLLGLGASLIPGLGVLSDMFQTCAVLAPAAAGFRDGCVLGSRASARKQGAAVDHRDAVYVRMMLLGGWGLFGAGYAFSGLSGWSLLLMTGAAHLSGFLMCRLVLQKAWPGPWVEPGGAGSRRWEVLGLLGAVAGLLLAAATVLLEPGSVVGRSMAEAFDQRGIGLPGLEGFTGVPGGMSVALAGGGLLALGVKDGCMACVRSPQDPAFGILVLPASRKEACGAALARCLSVALVLVAAGAGSSGMGALSTALVVAGFGISMWLIAHPGNWIRGVLGFGYWLVTAVTAAMTLVLAVCIRGQASPEISFAATAAAVFAAYLGIACAGALAGLCMRRAGVPVSASVWRGYARLPAAALLAVLLYFGLLVASGESGMQLSGEWWWPAIAMFVLAPAFLAVTAFCDGLWLAARDGGGCPAYTGLAGSGSRA